MPFLAARTRNEIMCRLSLVVLCLFCCLALAACGPGPGQEPEPVDIIPDPGFEAKADGWQLDNGAVCQDNAGYAHSGSGSLFMPGKVEAGGPPAIAGIIITSGFSPGQTYRLSFHAYGTDADGILLAVNFHFFREDDGEGAEISQHTDLLITATNYASHDVSFTVPEGTVGIEFIIINYGLEGGDIRLDDLAVVACGASGATNLLGNPGFEGTGIWELHNGAAYRAGAANAHTGNGYMFLPGNTSSAIETAIGGGFASGQTHVLCFYARGDAEGVDCRAYVSFTGSNDREMLEIPFTASAYTGYTLSYVVPAGATQIIIAFANEGGAGRDLYLDDVSVRAIRG